MYRTAVPLVAAVVVLLAACATTGAGSRSSSFGELTAEEIRATGAPDAYIAIQQLRPRWLRQRGSSSINNPTPRVVYVDNQRFGGLESLRQISADAIERAVYLDASEATQRFGTGHVNGAILVFTR